MRQRAERLLKTIFAKTIPGQAPENVETLVRELQIQQGELEVLNEELRRSREEAEATRDHYDLYESSRDAYRLGV